MRPLVIAHRGASGYLPEHTLPAKAVAHEMGADYLEQDIVATRDGELVVLHDIYLDRVTDVGERFPDRERDDGRYYVLDFDLEELRTLSVWERVGEDGSPVYPKRYPARSGDFHISTLAEELAYIRELNRQSGREAGVYPEIKRPAWHQAHGIDPSPLVLDALSDAGYSDRYDPVFVQCFDDVEIRRLRTELDCPFKLVQLIGDNDWEEAATDYDALRTPAGLERVAETADAIGPAIAHLYVCEANAGVPTSTGLARQAHDVGLSVHPYTFRSDDLPPGFSSFDELLRFATAEIGVDALFTDFPDKVLQFLGNSPEK